MLKHWYNFPLLFPVAHTHQTSHYQQCFWQTVVLMQIKLGCMTLSHLGFFQGINLATCAFNHYMFCSLGNWKKKLQSIKHKLQLFFLCAQKSESIFFLTIEGLPVISNIILVFSWMTTSSIRSLQTIPCLPLWPFFTDCHSLLVSPLFLLSCMAFPYPSKLKILLSTFLSPNILWVFLLRRQCV